MRAALGLLAFLLAALPALAETDPGPPASLPPGASFPGSAVGFPGSGLGFPGNPVGYASNPVGFPSSPIAAPSSPVAAPASAIAAPSSGLSMREEKGGAVRFTLAADLLFDFDKADLRREADPVLETLVAQVQARLPGGRFRIEGHTDGKGMDRYNDSLSNRRAKSVQAWLTGKGRVPAARIVTTGLGKRRPVAPNTRPDGSDDPEGRQKNRRVEIVVQPAG